MCQHPIQIYHKGNHAYNCQKPHEPFAVLPQDITIHPKIQNPPNPEWCCRVQIYTSAEVPCQNMVYSSCHSTAGTRKTSNNKKRAKCMKNLSDHNINQNQKKHCYVIILYVCNDSLPNTFYIHLINPYYSFCISEISASTFSSLVAQLVQKRTIAGPFLNWASFMVKEYFSASFTAISYVRIGNC